jgi:hypothetical protein
MGNCATNDNYVREVTKAIGRLQQHASCQRKLWWTSRGHSFGKRRRAQRDVVLTHTQVTFVAALDAAVERVQVPKFVSEYPADLVYTVVSILSAPDVSRSFSDG